MRLPTPRTRVPALDDVLLAWSLSPDLHRVHPGASDVTIAETERIMQRRIPLAVRAIYEASDGASFFDGNLAVDPLLRQDNGLCLARNSTRLRSSGWGIPDELFIFGSNGSDSLYGVWLPQPSVIVSDAPVIEVGSPDEKMRHMALAGTSFTRFVRSVTAYCLLCEPSRYSRALDALGLPHDLRCSGGVDETVFAAVCRWADPDLPDIPPDPFTAPVSVGDLRERFGRHA